MTIEAEKALEAIHARLTGEWDNPSLVAFGPVTGDHKADILHIIDESGVSPVSGYYDPNHTQIQSVYDQGPEFSIRYIVNFWDGSGKPRWVKCAPDKVISAHREHVPKTPDEVEIDYRKLPYKLRKDITRFLRDKS